MAQLVKNLPAMGRPGFDPWVGKIPWRREKLLTQNSMDWRIPWTVQCMALQRVGHDWMTFTFQTLNFVDAFLVSSLAFNIVYYIFFSFFFFCKLHWLGFALYPLLIIPSLYSPPQHPSFNSSVTTSNEHSYHLVLDHLLYLSALIFQIFSYCL